MKRGDLVRWIGPTRFRNFPQSGELCIVMDIQPITNEDGTPVPEAGNRVRILTPEGVDSWERQKYLEVVSEGR